MRDDFEQQIQDFEKDHIYINSLKGCLGGIEDALEDLG